MEKRMLLERMLSKKDVILIKKLPEVWWSWCFQNRRKCFCSLATFVPDAVCNNVEKHPFLARNERVPSSCLKQPPPVVPKAEMMKILFKFKNLYKIKNKNTYSRILKANSSWSPTWAKLCQLIASLSVVLLQLNVTKLKLEYLKFGF